MFLWLNGYEVLPLICCMPYGCCQVRSALSALEAFAMEREDEAARLKHEKEELLEELKGVRSGQDRSAEEARCFFIMLRGGFGRAGGGEGSSTLRHFRMRGLALEWGDN